MSVFSERLRALRCEKGILQSAIAIELGVKANSYSTYENGREPNYDMLIKIAKYYDVSIDYLLGLSNVKKSNPTIAAISAQTGLSEWAIDNLMEETQTFRDYSKITFEARVAKHHKSYLDLVNVLLESHSLLYNAAQIYEDLIDALEKCDGAPDMNSLEELQDWYTEQEKPENKNMYVLTVGQQAEYCLYLLGQILHNMIKKSVDKKGLM